MPLTTVKQTVERQAVVEALREVGGWRGLRLRRLESDPRGSKDSVRRQRADCAEAQVSGRVDLEGHGRKCARGRRWVRLRRNRLAGAIHDADSGLRFNNNIKAVGAIDRDLSRDSDAAQQLFPASRRMEAL